MNGIKYLLDTCFIIELYNDNDEVLNIIHAKQIESSICAISPINRMEVLGFGKLEKQDKINLEQLLGNFESLIIDRTIENKVIELRQRYKIKLPDCIVLATALINELELLTLDNGLQNKFNQERLLKLI